jgi:diaminopimelate epimerase
MPGGELQIEIRDDESVYMTGRVNSIGITALSKPFIDELEGLK